MHKHNWQDYRVENIIGGKSADGVSLLELFIEDFKQLFKVKNPNINCTLCVRQYHKEYVLKLQEMESNCDYVLQKKYIGIPLENSGKNSSISVTNKNLTNAYAKILLKRFKDPKKIFDKFPKEELKEQTEETKEPKKVAKRVKKTKK